MRVDFPLSLRREAGARNEAGRALALPAAKDGCDVKRGGPGRGAADAGPALVPGSVLAPRLTGAGVIGRRWQILRPLTDAIIRSGYEAYPDGINPFGLRMDEFSDYAATQFRKRYARIAKARDRSLAEIEASSEPADVEDLLAEV